MATYSYKARDKYGKLIEGVMGADLENAVAQKLGQMGHIPVAIALVKEEKVSLKALSSLRGVKFSDLNMFTRQLYTLQKAGLPLLSGLNAIKEQTSSRLLKEVLTQVARDIEGGSDLSSALARFPGIFNAIYVSMIRAGEASGRLVEILERLSILGEHEEKVRMRINAAMRYPLIVVVAIMCGFLVLITFVVPRFSHLYNQHAVALPLPTQILIGINYVVTHFWWAIAVVVGVTVYMLQQFIKTPPGRFWWDGLKLKIPVFGQLFLYIMMSRFCRITGTLMKSGVPILQILDLVGSGVGNSVISKTITAIKKGVNEGKGMSEPMKASAMFPPIVVEMVSVGESTGKTDELLLYVSDYYDSQVDFTISNLVTLIEPILIVFLGCMVLVMALGIFMPMWGMMRLFVK